MNTKEFFEKVVTPRFEACVMLMAMKDGEYKRNNNKFHNFYRASCVGDTTPEVALLGMWMKHIVSLLDMVDDIGRGTYKFNDLFLSEKMNDNHNYLFLLEGIIRERYKAD